MSVDAIISALTEGHELPVGSEGWEIQRKLKQAIVEGIALIPGMSFIEGDS